MQSVREDVYPGSSDHADSPRPIQVRLKRSFFSLDAFIYICICAIPSLVMLLCIWLFVGSGNEVTVFFKKVKGEFPLLTKSLKFFTNWVNFFIYAIYLVIFVKGVKKKDSPSVRFVIIFAVTQLIIPFLLVRVFKVVTGRARPNVMLRMEPEYNSFSLSSSYHSFPSGHAAEVTGMTTVLSLWFRRYHITVACSLINTLSSFSRVYLNWHHVSDVVAGILAGAVVTFIIHYLCMRDRT